MSRLRLESLRGMNQAQAWFWGSLLGVFSLIAGASLSQSRNQGNNNTFMANFSRR